VRQRKAGVVTGKIDQAVEDPTSILEPMLIVIVGLVVATVSISPTLPMFD
jgi:type II secretory pathway component PulF